MRRHHFLFALVVFVSCCGSQSDTATEVADLLRLDQEPPGTNCPSGGIAINAGNDGNGDGVLDAEEVTSTEYLCDASSFSGVLEGSYVIANSLDVALVANVTEITNGLSILAPGLTTVNLPLLTSIGGNFTVLNDNDLTNLTLPNLTTVGGSVGVTGNAALTSLAGLDALSNISGNLLVNGNAALSSTDLPELASVGGNLDVSYNIAITSLAGLAEVTIVGGDFSVKNNTLLATLGLDHLTTVAGTFNVLDNPQLPDCQASNLLTQLVGFSGTVNVSGNTGTGGCP